jgi:hypothetical protein
MPDDSQAAGNPPTPPPAGGGQQPQKDGPPPPRPGEAVPEEGLDPTQVFATPPAPPPPPPAKGQDPAAGQTGDGGQPPVKDSGKPPPPVGTPVDAEKLKADGYDDEDIRVLGVVGDYRFGSMSLSLTTESIVVPEHPETNFDEQEFLGLLAGSISLMRDEKWRIIQAMPKLSQFQIDELKKILTEEKKKFSELSPKHLVQLQKLEQKHGDDWRDLQSLMVQEGAKKEETAQADEIRKKLGL